MPNGEVSADGSATPSKGPVQPDAFANAALRLRDLCDEDMTALDADLQNSLTSRTTIIPDIAGHLINAGGKRLRPLLTIAAARAVNDGAPAPDNHHIHLASAVELIHGATLLHDDVVDGSDLRRGRRTANIIWGNKESILVGDFLFSRAFELMVAVGDLRVLHILSAASGVIAEGEVMQLSTQKNLDATFEMYLAVIDAKTAALFAAAAETGAIVGGANPDLVKNFHAFGRHLGVAFQLVDDALDYAGLEAALGKNVGDDFREGKMTMPVVCALAKATEVERRFWRQSFSDNAQTPEDFTRALEIMDRTGAVEETFASARRYAAMALDNLAAAPNNAFSAALRDVAEQSVARAY